VLRDRRLRHIKRFCQFPNRSFPLRQPRKDGAASGMSDSVEGSIQFHKYYLI
jgi:hypothetical protein